MNAYKQALINTKLTTSFKDFYFLGEWHNYLGKERIYHQLQAKSDKKIRYLSDEQFLSLISALINEIDQ